MKKILFPALVFSMWMALLSTDIPVKGKFLPATGRFFNPFMGIWQSVGNEDGVSYALKGGVKEHVSVLFDERDIPHIYASSLEDAVFTQGYLHASQRLFAMDIATRAAAGRLSEIIGERTLLLDRKAREKGYEYSAERKVIAWQKDPETRRLIEAYTAGVNAYVTYLSYKEWPVEYKVLSQAPITWTTKHTALAVTNMAIALCVREDDLSYTTAKNYLSPEEFSFLFPEHNAKQTPVIPGGTVWNFSPLLLNSDSVSVNYPTPKSTQEDIRQKPINGSNNWAVSGKKTASGHPLLANDPHLRLTLPAVWYEMEMHVPGMSVHGVSNPGIPFILLGFNQDIAWGSTNSGLDVLDWYAVKWENSSRQRYLFNGDYIEAKLRPETIEVRGATSITDTIRYTHFGPVSQIGEYTDLAMKWVGHDQSDVNDALTFLNINRSRNFDEFRDGVKNFAYPAQNLVFASTSGDIGLVVTGRVPIRPQGQGELIVEGQKDTDDWLDYIPYHHTPFLYNPERGYVSSANQVRADSTYPYPLPGKRLLEDYRSRMINQVLDTSVDMTAADMIALQQNNYSLLASELLPILLQAVDSADCAEGPALEIIQQLKNWNFDYHRDSLSPVYFDLLMDAFERLTWDELIANDLMLPEQWRLIEIASEDPDNIYFDLAKTTEVIETLKDIACAAISEMVRNYRQLTDGHHANWGQYKASSVPHIARFKGFGIDTLHTSGGRNIVNCMQKSHGPSWKMVVDLSSPPQAWVNYPGGQSGNSTSKHYHDMLDRYFEGHYYKIQLRPDPEKWVYTRKIDLHP